MRGRHMRIYDIYIQYKYDHTFNICIIYIYIPIYLFFFLSTYLSICVYMCVCVYSI